ncbi:GNAT family N-acetyltransferase [Nannocystis pusilla]|uniref:GNAT family N-acetyltransferase n=1 Tax=Nannocystis pusilla TaxID=889268 RepID=UPI003B7D1CF9
MRDLLPSLHGPRAPARGPRRLRDLRPALPRARHGRPDPSPAHWAAEIVPNTWLFEQDGEAVGYLFFERLDGVGYIRHVVVAPERRGQGIGLAMLRAAAAELRAAGCVTWCLNVKPGNLPAVGLYQRLGMREAYRSTALRFAWAQTDALPACARSLETRAIEPADDAAIEAAFSSRAGSSRAGAPPGGCCSASSTRPSRARSTSASPRSTPIFRALFRSASPTPSSPLRCWPACARTPAPTSPTWASSPRPTPA